MRYSIYIMFRNGCEGYFTKVEDGVVHYWSVDEPTYNSEHYYATTYDRALSKAKWLCKTFRCVGRTEIVKKDPRYL